MPTRSTRAQKFNYKVLGLPYLSRKQILEAIYIYIYIYIILRSQKISITHKNFSNINKIKFHLRRCFSSRKPFNFQFCDFEVKRSADLLIHPINCVDCPCHLSSVVQVGQGSILTYELIFLIIKRKKFTKYILAYISKWRRISTINTN